MTFRLAVRSTAALLLVLSAGCGISPTSALLAKQHAAQAAAARDIDTAGTEASFIAAVKSKGVDLTPDQLVELQQERHVVPNDTWAPRPAANLTADQNLQTHFLKHGHEFNPPLPSAAAYMAQGNAVGEGKRGTVEFLFDITSYTKGYQTHVMRYVAATHDFTAFRTDGSETTYYQTTPAANRFVPIPAW